MRLQEKVLIEIQGKTNSEKNGHLQDVCGSPDYRNGFSYNMNKLICETKQQGHPWNLFLTLSVPQRNLAGWQKYRCFNELAGKFCY